MRRLQILILFSIICITTWGQECKTIKFDYDAFSLRDSISNDLSFMQIIEKVNTYCSTDTQKLCLVAGWIFKNIDFDLDKFYTGTSEMMNDYKVVFNQRKGICGDYATLFSKFCDELHITNEIIEGYVPEYNSDNKIYYETNHAWNVIKIGETWYHCDLLGFSGYLKQNKLGEFQFIKQVDTYNFLTQNIYFISKHIPADPMWQLSDYPIPLDTLIINGYNSKNDSTQRCFDYKKEIENYLSLSKTEQLLKFSDDSYNYNSNNSNAIVINYYNTAVDLINDWNNDKTKLIKAKQYLEKAKRYVPKAKNGAEILKNDIDSGLEIIKKYVP
ncbi:transglutaminase domain-containing protein [Labilibaculum euxinus]